MIIFNVHQKVTQAKMDLRIYPEKVGIKEKNSDNLCHIIFILKICPIKVAYLAFLPCLLIFYRFFKKYFHIKIYVLQYLRLLPRFERKFFTQLNYC